MMVGSGVEEASDVQLRRPKKRMSEQVNIDRQAEIQVSKGE